MGVDPYKLLGVDKNADANAIKSAYRKLARKYHPDVNPGDQAAENKFKEISESYDILSDPAKKKEYDNLGGDAFYEKAFGGTGYQRPDFNQGGFSFEDIFGELFGGASPGASSNRRNNFDRGLAPKPQKGADVDFKLTISLAEVASGTETKLVVNTPYPCPQCQGQGVMSSGGGVRSCSRCAGKGTVSQPKNLKVKIPAAIKEGQKIRLAGKGSPGENGGAAGDILVEVTIKPDPIFTYKGTNLYADAPVGLYEALLGGTVQVPTLTSRAQLKVPAGTQNGAKMRLKGQGMPANKTEPTGDLYLTIKVILPTQLTDEAKELVSTLAALAPTNTTE